MASVLVGMNSPYFYFFPKWVSVGFGVGLSVAIVIAARRARPGLLHGLVVGVAAGILLQSLCWGLVS
ncbi:MAG TPA: hypothetical protein VGU27_01665 [Candidatus Eisenbacteria bacterium]|nr:hypothetical protein [Candidatus Eisenbacteria bacterium]